MKGIHKVVVGTKYLKYEFELRRNLTVIRGDSATGKTTLVDMIRTHMNDGESGPITLNCDKGCYVVEGNLWKGQLNNIQDSIVFIDEGNEFVKTKDFARAIQQTDNYYVIVTRLASSAIQCGRSVWYPNLWKVWLTETELPLVLSNLPG